jgi:hypothetical protein
MFLDSEKCYSSILQAFSVMRRVMSLTPTDLASDLAAHEHPGDYFPTSCFFVSSQSLNSL